MRAYHTHTSATPGAPADPMKGPPRPDTNRRRIRWAARRRSPGAEPGIAWPRRPRPHEPRSSKSRSRSCLRLRTMVWHLFSSGALKV